MRRPESRHMRKTEGILFRRLNPSRNQQNNENDDDDSDDANANSPARTWVPHALMDATTDWTNSGSN